MKNIDIDVLILYIILSLSLALSFGIASATICWLLSICFCFKDIYWVGFFTGFVLSFPIILITFLKQEDSK